MKCPHCNMAGKKLVLESRTHEDNLYRKRLCGACGKTFVTEEVVRPSSTLPRPSGPARAKAKHGAPVSGVIRSTGQHLEGIWR